MEENVNYTAVGAFVILLTMAIIAGIIWLAVGFNTEEYSIYRIFMKESVSGLSEDGPVEYNGVNVGHVSSMTIDRKNPQLVKLLISIKSKTPITQGTRAKLGVRFLSGVAYILLEDKGNDMRPLVKRSDQPYPVINTSPSILLRMDTAITHISDSFEQLSKSISSLLDKENLLAIKQTLSSMDRLTQNFEAQTLPVMNTAITNFDYLSRNLSEISSDLKQNPAILIRGKAQRNLGPGEK